VTADVVRLAMGTPAPIAAVCRALEVARSTVYARRKRPASLRQAEQARVDLEVAAIHRQRKGRYGSPRVYKEMRAKGWRIGKKRVEASMRKQQIRGKRTKGFRRTTQANPAHVPAPNILNRAFTAQRPNEAWVGDITYVRTLAGWAYVALLIDLCTRKIVGWAVGEHCDTQLALRALNAAVARHRPGPGLLHHTDRGSTYTSNDYRERLRELDFTVSMSRKGNCWDNAVAEATIGSVKAELLDDRVAEDRHALVTELFRYIEGFYNRERLHSSLGYRSPDQVEEDFIGSKSLKKVA
jgi:putative transposase